MYNHPWLSGDAILACLDACAARRPEDNYGVVGVQPEMDEQEAEETERLNEFAPLLGPSRISISRCACATLLMHWVMPVQPVRWAASRSLTGASWEVLADTVR